MASRPMTRRYSARLPWFLRPVPSSQHQFPRGARCASIPWSPCVTSRRRRMAFLRNITSGLRSLFRKEQVDQELNEELSAYLEMAAAEKMRQGMNRKDALRAVRLERGNLEVTKEVVRSAGWESVLETYWRDVRLGVRTLLKSPSFTVVVVLTLALGIGANTAIFTLIDTVMLRSLPVANPRQLY